MSENNNKETENDLIVKDVDVDDLEIYKVKTNLQAEITENNNNYDENVEKKKYEINKKNTDDEIYEVVETIKNEQEPPQKINKEEAQKFINIFENKNSYKVSFFKNIEEYGSKKKLILNKNDYLQILNLIELNLIKGIGFSYFVRERTIDEDGEEFQKLKEELAKKKYNIDE